MLGGIFLMLALAMIIYMSLWFAYGFLYLNRIDSVDSAWGLGFIYIATITLLVQGNYQAVSMLSFALVCIWGLRLFWHITLRNIKKPEDSRYEVFRQKYANKLKTLIFTRIFLFQGLLIILVSFASIAVLTSKNFNEPLAYIGLAVWASGIVLESVADAQLRKFLKQKTGGIMQSGLWKYSRHPNYFGEITAWSGAAITACAGGSYWGVIGPVVIAFLIIRISGLPPIEKKYADNADYQAYKKRTSVLLPLPPKH